MPYANKKDADQSVHPCSLIGIFVIHSLDSLIPVGIYRKFWLDRLVWVLPGDWSHKSKGRFSHDEAQDGVSPCENVFIT